VNGLLIEYALLAALVIFVTSRASFYVDQLDKKTTLSGAIIGGVLLAVVTSLPELITTLTSTLSLNNPGLAFGNVFGSNLFNLLILAVVDIVFIKHRFYSVTEADTKPVSLSVLMYMVFIVPVMLHRFTGFDINSLGISVGLSFNMISLVIIVIYIMSIRIMGTRLTPKKVTRSPYPLKTIVVRFSFYALGVIVLSYFITHTASDLSAHYNLSDSFGGALFLGAATSLPELTAVVTLFKLRNYAVALGNIIGSNIFNMLILSIVDFVYIRENIYRVFNGASSSENIALLLILGALNSIMVLVALKRKSPTHAVLYSVPSAIIIIVYVIYIVNSV